MLSTFRIHSFVNSRYTNFLSVVVVFCLFSLVACSEAKSKEKEHEQSNSIAGLVIEPAQKNGVFYQLDNLASAIKAGKQQQKRVLIYFTGWYCVNSRKIEDRILIDKNIQALLAENYLCFSAYTDDRTKIEGSDMTVGEKNANLQIEQFKSNLQPYFYVLDENGIVVSDIQYALTVAEFEAFLKKGLK